jgi:phosphoribosylformimino-5-aminoimidazole carboxamide ribotide isomerase
MNMQIIPAIDLLDGSCVRLLHGDFNKCKVYDLDAVRLAATYAREGAQWLHVVDLAASRDGNSADIRPLLRLLGETEQSVQTGGGVRSGSDIQTRLDNGASRVVIGSLSVEEPERFAKWIESFGSERLVAALDVRLEQDGSPLLRTHGWTRGSGETLWQLLDFYADKGLRHVLCTDIGRDGAMTGPNLDLYQQITRRYPDLAIQASGGVSGLLDLQKLSTTGVGGAITGKALLEGCFTVAEAIEALS